MLQNINFSAATEQFSGLQRVDKARLAQTGKSASFSFAKGDKITFPAVEDIAAYNDPFKRKDGTEIECVKFLAALNGRIKLIPCGAIDKIPFGQIEQWLMDHELNREIHNAGDAWSRLEMLAGKTIIVTEMVKGPRADFDATGQLQYNEDGTYKTKDGLFPVFDWYEEK